MGSGLAAYDRVVVEGFQRIGLGDTVMTEVVAASFAVPRVPQQIAALTVLGCIRRIGCARLGLPPWHKPSTGPSLRVIAIIIMLPKAMPSIKTLPLEQYLNIQLPGKGGRSAPTTPAHRPKPWKTRSRR